MITNMDKSNADKDSYSRKLTDSERERMDKLREQYENEGRFPEGKVAVVDKEEDANRRTDNICNNNKNLCNT